MRTNRCLRSLPVRWLGAMVLCPGWLATQCLTAASLPEVSASISIPAQEWPFQPGPREVAVHVRYPGSKLGEVKATTGLMLSLHNWGGSGFTGAPDPDVLAREYDVVAIGVDYLQSGPKAALEGPPYDFGYLQALDALRALHFVFAGLGERGIAFHRGRLFATGGSGGGNVTLMANKLAPHTFACVIDLCGMKRLSDDIAFDLPGGSALNARYSRDLSSPFHLTPDRQELHFLGNPAHLQVQRAYGPGARIVSVHGRGDDLCPFSDAREFVVNALAANLPVDAWFVTPELLDGKAFTSTGHSLGDRTLIVDRVAGRYLRPGSPESLVRKGPTDFERRETIRYPTARGTYVVDYAAGFPVCRFEALSP